MKFAAYFSEQLKKHPSMQPLDVVKLCYQAARGAEHLLADPDAAKRYLEAEFATVDAMGGDLYEPISDAVCRVNLAAWKGRNLPLPWLFRMFAAPREEDRRAEDRLAAYLEEAEAVLRREEIAFAMDDFTDFMRQYKKIGMPAVHHSEPYRLREHPAYRIVDSRFCEILPILEKVAEASDSEKPFVIAIDGRAASGKTTLAKALQVALDADVIHMDDFFLPPARRTEARREEIGGNIHYERFLEEVIPFVAKGEPFSYGIFDCGIMDFNGTRSIGNGDYRIVEGAYSLHPLFEDYADLTVFSHVDPEEQRERIRRRNGEQMLALFCDRWIPMEERYFAHFRIAQKASVVLSPGHNGK